MSNWIKYHCLYHNKFYLQIGAVPPEKPGFLNRMVSHFLFLDKKRYEKALDDPNNKFHNAAVYRNFKHKNED